MPGLFEQALTGGMRSQDDIVQALARRAELQSFRPKPNPSLLTRIGKILDFPGMLVRSALAGKYGASGKDILRTLGVRRPGGIMSFLAEVGLDPLTYVGGFGALTKTGKMASRLAGLGRHVKPLLRHSTYLPTMVGKQAARQQLISTLLKRKALRSKLLSMGAPTALAKGAAAQARTAIPQRALLTAGLPFGAEKVVLRGAPVLGAVGRAGAAVGAPAAIQGLKKLFRTPLRRFPEAQEASMLGEMLKRRAGGETVERSAQMGAKLAELEEKSGLPKQEFLNKFFDIRESLGVGKRIGERMSRLTETKESAIKKIIEAHAERQRGRAEEAMKTGEEFYKGMLKEAPKAAERKREQYYTKGLKLLSREPYYKEKMKIGRLEEKFQKKIGELAKEQEEVNTIAKSMGPEVEGYARNLLNETERAFQAQVSAGARPEGSRLVTLTKEFADRVETPEARAWRRANPEKAKQFDAAVSRRLTTKEGSQIRRVKRFREEYTTAVNEQLKKERDIDFNWFQTDPSKALPARFLQREVSIVNANTIKSFADEFARKAQPGDVPLSEMLSKGPIYNYRGIALGKSPERIEKQLAGIGKGGLGVPPELMEVVQDLQARLNSPEELKPLTKIYDQYLGVMRWSLTSPWPAFHVRNSMTNIVMNWLGGVNNPRFYAQAMREMLNPTQAKHYKEIGLFRGQIADILKEIGALGAEGELKKGVINKMFRGSAKASEVVENFSRLAHFLSKKAEGLTDVQALQSVNKYLFDYSDITKFEKGVGKRVAMFYQWTRKALPLILGQYLESPAKMAALTRVVAQPSMERRAEPEYLRKTLAIPAGTSREGGQRYITGLGLPLEELQKFDVFSKTEPGGAGRSLLQSIAGLTATPIRAGLEFTAGRNFFLDKPILESDRAPTVGRFMPEWMKKLTSFRESTSPSGFRRFRADPLLLWALQQTPASRLLTSAGKIADPRKTAGEKLLNLLTGVRTTNVDEQSAEMNAKAMAIRTLLNEAVRTGDAGIFRGYFALGKEGEKSEDVQKLLRLLRNLSKERKDYAANQVPSAQR